MNVRGWLKRIAQGLVWVLALALGLPVVFAAATLDGSNVRVTTADFFPSDVFGASIGFPDVFQQNEPSIAQHPVHSNLLAVGANDLRAFSKSQDAWVSLAWSNDAGANWPDVNQSLVPGFPNDNTAAGLSSPIRGNAAASDPWLGFDRYGNLFFAFIAFQRAFPLEPGTSPDQANAVAVAKYSVSNATEFNPPGSESIAYLKTVVVERGTKGKGRQEDKEALAVDNTGGDLDGNVYVCWSRFTGSMDHLMFSRSTDHGDTYSKAIKLDEGTPSIQGCNTAVAPNGTIFVAYRKFGIAPSAPQARGIFVVKSTDGGRTFGKPVRVSGFTDYVQVSNRSPATFRVFTNPSIAADATAVYVAWVTRNVSTGADVQVSCSADGVDWSAQVIPHKLTPNGHQLMPALAAGGGKVSVLWYDSRSEPSFTPTGPVSGSNNGVGVGMEVFYKQAASACPLAFDADQDVAVTTQSFNPNLYASGRAITPFIGDYIAIVADATKAYAVWTDNRDIVPRQNANEDNDPATNLAALINARSRDSNIYFQRINKYHRVASPIIF